jgi:hypothetical protein
MFLRRVVPFLLVCASTGCVESTGIGACTTEARASVSVLVRDDLTGAYIASGATLVLHDGSFADSTSFPAGAPAYDPLALATDNSFERAGVYDVTVRRAGYFDWELQNVTVTQGRCHVRSVVLTARLTPLP